MPPAEGSDKSADDDLVKADREGVITHWGRDFERTFGFSAEEAVGRQVSLIIPPVLEALHWRGFNKAVSNGELKRDGKTIKVPAIHRGGGVLAVKGRISLELTDKGSVDQVLLRLVGEGPSWARPLWRAVLAVLNAGQALAARIRPRGGVS